MARRDRSKTTQIATLVFMFSMLGILLLVIISAAWQFVIRPIWGV